MTIHACKYCGTKPTIMIKYFIDPKSCITKQKVKIVCEECHQEFETETDNSDVATEAWNWANRPKKEDNENITEHDWQKDEDGNIDTWAFEDVDSIHHGPVCKKCGYSFCVECNPEGWNAQPCEQE